MNEISRRNSRLRSVRCDGGGDDGLVSACQSWSGAPTDLQNCGVQGLGRRRGAVSAEAENISEF